VTHGKRSRLRRFGLALLSAMPWAAATGLQSGTAGAAPDVRLLARADSVVRAWMAFHHLPGVALAVVHRGQVVLARGYGTRDEASAPRSIRTRPFRSPRSRNR
jgi:CubicO group peptidase (beta-lactamase class C family)